MKISTVLTTLGITLAGFTATRPAHALGPIGIELGAKAGVGTNPASGDTVNPLGFGIGGRGGVTFLGFYGGLNAMYYLGGSGNEGGTSYSVHSFLYGLEAGYGITLLDLVTVRALIGVGNFTGTTSVGDISQSASHLYLEPGVMAMLGLGTFFVGADVNALLIPSGLADGSLASALTVRGQVGVKFSRAAIG